MSSGSPAIAMFNPSVGNQAVRDVIDTLRSGWISEGKGVRAFEEAFSRRFSLSRCLAVNSGTAALHLACIAAGIKEGDEVITTAQTFVSTALAPLYCGASVVFADLKKNSPNVDPKDIARRVSERTKAIVVVHYGGLPCDMDEINEIATWCKIKVIEDAAHALGATYRGKPVGKLGDFAAFSFQAIKQLTTADGGMLTCSDGKLGDMCRRLRWLGIDRVNRVPSETGQPEYNIKEVGYKYHMNDVAAAMGLGHLRGLFDAEQQRRKDLNRRYRSALAAVSGAQLLDEDGDRESAAWLFTMLVERRLDFCRAMKSRGVEAAAWHRRIDSNSVFGGKRRDLPNLVHFDEHQVSVPMRPDLSEDEVETILRCVKEGW